MPETEAEVQSQDDDEVSVEESRDTDPGVDKDEDRQNREIFEALLIASDDPLPVGRIVSILKGVGARDIRRFVDDLNTVYLDTARAFTITEVAGGFQFAVHREYAFWVRQLARDKAAPRLSIAALESLAVIAFRQPVTKTEVEDVRGVSVDGVLRHLLEKGLIRIAGRAEGPGRPLLYGTTRDFLKHFGLKTLSDLPRPREIEELLKEREEAFDGEGIIAPPAGVGEEGEEPGADISGSILETEENEAGGDVDGPMDGQNGSARHSSEEQHETDEHGNEQHGTEEHGNGPLSDELPEEGQPPGISGQGASEPLPGSGRSGLPEGE